MKINFGKLAKAGHSGAPVTLNELFDKLDRKTTHQSLRTVQSDAFAEINKQLSERDVVLKLSTGSGKTLVGLVYAELMRRKYPGEPVVYLCPTNQLVEQVVETAQFIGITVERFPNKGRPFEAFAGKAVLVCTYDRLFNARNVFENDNIVPSAIILDDVHAGIDRVRGSYSVEIPSDLYDQVRDIFHKLCEPSDHKIWRGIMNNEADAIFEVPFWIWSQQHQEIARLLGQCEEDSRDVLFRWGNLARYSEYCRLCISGTRAELSFYVPPVEDNGSYTRVKHRLYMSASVKDGSSLIRELDCDPVALKRVIEIESDRGAGERMILPVALIDPALSRDDLRPLCEAALKKANIVALTSSSKQADAWVSLGANVKKADAVDGAVADLRTNSRGIFYAFPQRFDGVDLADDACRVLIIDGTPMGDRLADQVDFQRQKNSPGYNVRVVNRFEQALGRAVRSSADYAAILLVGSDIAAFIGRKDVRDLLEGNTREQIELGKELAGDLKEEGDSLAAVSAAVDSLLRRDEDWKEAHRERMAAVHRIVRQPGMLTIGEQIAAAERLAWSSAKARNHQAAASQLESCTNSVKLDDTQTAEMLYRRAAYLYGVDSGNSLAIFRKAFQINNVFPRPVELPDKKYVQAGPQAVRWREQCQKYTDGAAVIARLEEIRARLAYSGDAERVEAALQELGEVLGAESSRPEKETGRGPDVLWQFEDVIFCLEAKSEKTSKIFKADAEQLLLSAQWCGDQLGAPSEMVVPVFATNSMKADRPEDISFGPYFMLESDVFGLIDSLKSVVSASSFDGPLFNDVAKTHALLQSERVLGKNIIKRLRR
ncbi:DEAD/DEAH box helicase [Cupriavidus taiwanensis]|uniref:DEAD/DEAH box helicase n=1 Tax=Cupriavidus taiwanensis TaxID=164546 RepID=UPI001F000675|nr:DEAD/DEAH box helicase [Cupriavidus taiwanensis]